MTSPVSRDSLVAIRAELYPWADPGLRELLAAAAYALDVDDHIATLVAGRQYRRDEAARLRERVAELEAEVSRLQRDRKLRGGA